MISYPIASNEKQRLAVLDEYHIIQTNKEAEFERISALAKAFFGTKIVAITFLDADIQFFKSKIGLKEHSTSRDVAFCNYTITPLHKTTPLSRSILTKIADLKTILWLPVTHIFGFMLAHPSWFTTVKVGNLLWVRCV